MEALTLFKGMLLHLSPDHNSPSTLSLLFLLGSFVFVFSWWKEPLIFGGMDQPNSRSNDGFAEQPPPYYANPPPYNPNPPPYNPQAYYENVVPGMSYEVGSYGRLVLLTFHPCLCPINFDFNVQLILIAKKKKTLHQLLIITKPSQNNSADTFLSLYTSQRTRRKMLICSKLVVAWSA